MTTLKDHPKQQLLFFVAQDFNNSLVIDVKIFVEKLEYLKDWVIGPPEFIDELSEPDSGPLIRTLGGSLEIYSAMPPLRLPRDIDLRHLEEVEALVEKVCEFSKKYGLAIEFNLDGKFVGAVEDGQADRTLREGLIDEWRRQLEST